MAGAASATEVPSAGTSTSLMVAGGIIASHGTVSLNADTLSLFSHIKTLITNTQTQESVAEQVYSGYAEADQVASDFVNVYDASQDITSVQGRQIFSVTMSVLRWVIYGIKNYIEPQLNKTAT